MLSGEDNENGENTAIGLISKKATLLGSTLFLYISLLLFSVDLSFLLELRWPVAFFFFICRFSFSIFKYFRQHGDRNNFRFPLSLLHNTRVAMRFSAKISSSCTWLSYLTIPPRARMVSESIAHEDVPNGLWVNSRWGLRPHGLLTHSGSRNN